MTPAHLKLVPPSAIPAELRAIDRWLVWVDAKKAKLPGKKAPVDEDGRADKHWQDSRLPFLVASKRAKSINHAGIGFVLGDTVAGLDLDNCRDPESGKLVESAQILLDVFAEGAYVEVSPSGKGVKVFGPGEGWLELNFHEGNGDVDALRKMTGYFAVTGEEYQEGGINVDLKLDALEMHFGSTSKAGVEVRAAPGDDPVRLPA